MTSDLYTQYFLISRGLKILTLLFEAFTIRSKSEFCQKIVHLTCFLHLLTQFDGQRELEMHISEQYYS